MVSIVLCAKIGRFLKKRESRMSENNTPFAGPATGLGSGLAQNQAVSGALNPEMAAKIASLPAGEVQKALDQLEAHNRQTDELRQTLAAEEAAGRFDPPKPLELASPEEMKKWKKELDRKKEEQEQKAAEEDTSLMSMSIGMDHPLYNPISDTARRRRIESKVTDLDFDQMVFVGHCDQEVTVRKGFKVVFRTLSTQHGLWLEIMLTNISRGSSEQYLRHWYSLSQTAASLQSINGKSIGTDLSSFITEDHRDDFIAAVKKRMEYLGRMPSIITDDLIVNYTWFCGRVRKLLSEDLVEKVGNS